MKLAHRLSDFIPFLGSDIVNIIVSFLHPLEVVLMDTTGELNELELKNFALQCFRGENDGLQKISSLVDETLTRDLSVYEEACNFMKQTKNSRILEFFNILQSQEQDFYRWVFPMLRRSVRNKEPTIWGHELIFCGETLDYFVYTLLKISIRQLYFASNGFCLQGSFFNCLLSMLSGDYKFILGEKSALVISSHAYSTRTPFH